MSIDMTMLYFGEKTGEMVNKGGVMTEFVRKSPSRFFEIFDTGDIIFKKNDRLAFEGCDLLGGDMVPLSYRCHIKCYLKASLIGIGLYASAQSSPLAHYYLLDWMSKPTRESTRH